MEPNSCSKDMEAIIEQIKESFPSVYLTLTSIIQACVFGYLLFLLGTHLPNLSPISTTTILIVSTFLLIITTWNEYMMGATAFRWIPGVKDAFIPFTIGFSEFLMVHNVFSNVSLWCYSVALFCLMGFLSYLNGSYNARRYPENTATLDRISHLRTLTVVWVFSCAIIAIFLGILSDKFDTSLIVQYITVSFSLVMSGAFLYRGVLYWNRIVGATSKRAITFEKTQSETQRRSSEEDRTSPPERRRPANIQTTKQFYQHSDTGSLYAIEMSWDGHIVSSAGPLEEQLQDPDSYNYTTELNEWLETQNDKLILI